MIEYNLFCNKKEINSDKEINRLNNILIYTSLDYTNLENVIKNDKFYSSANTMEVYKSGYNIVNNDTFSFNDFITLDLNISTFELLREYQKLIKQYIIYIRNNDYNNINIKYIDKKLIETNNKVILILRTFPYFNYIMYNIYYKNYIRIDYSNFDLTSYNNETILYYFYIDDVNKRLYNIIQFYNENKNIYDYYIQNKNKNDYSFKIDEDNMNIIKEFFTLFLKIRSINDILLFKEKFEIILNDIDDRTSNKIKIISGLMNSLNNFYYLKSKDISSYTIENTDHLKILLKFETKDSLVSYNNKLLEEIKPSIDIYKSNFNKDLLNNLVSDKFNILYLYLINKLISLYDSNSLFEESYILEIKEEFNLVYKTLNMSNVINKNILYSLLFSDKKLKIIFNDNTDLQKIISSDIIKSDFTVLINNSKNYIN